MYQQTHDFSDLRAVNALEDHEVDTHLDNRGLPTDGHRHDRILRLLDHGWAPQPSRSPSEAEVSLPQAPLVAGTGVA